MTPDLSPLWPHWHSAWLQALEAAEGYRGATAPNPPVGAAALDAQGQLLSVQAHSRAGTLHAEAKVFEDCAQRGISSQIDTLIVTLEPCNHHGRTPPCSEAILRSSTKRVLFALRDPNPRVPGQGMMRLRENGLEVHCFEEIPALSADPLLQRSKELLAPFATAIQEEIPYVTIKSAWRRTADGRLTMLPDPGQKTFTRPSSLDLAHSLRKRADALLTGSGTVLADRPDFRVRRIPDHPEKSRWLAVLDRSERVSETASDWLELKRSQGFRLVPKEITRTGRIPEVLGFLGQQGVLEVLVEAGPALTQAFLELGLWNEHYRIERSEDGPNDSEDQVERFFNSRSFERKQAL